MNNSKNPWISSKGRPSYTYTYIYIYILALRKARKASVGGRTSTANRKWPTSIVTICALLLLEINCSWRPLNLTYRYAHSCSLIACGASDIEGFRQQN